MLKLCTVCKQEKDTSLFHKHKQCKDGIHSWCKDCNKAKNRGYNDKHRERYREYHRNYYRNIKNKVVEAYGSKCACCGEAERLFLTLDHVHGGGGQHRKNKGVNSPYVDALARNFPSDYQILCFNCNAAKGFYGECPHKSK